MTDPAVIQAIAKEVAAKPEQVAAAISLFEKGASIPFVARYRKDATGNLSEAKLDTIFDRNHEYHSLLQRRKSICETLESRGQLTESLKQELDACIDPRELEDIYLPYRRRRRADGLAPNIPALMQLADFLQAQQGTPDDLMTQATRSIDPTHGIETQDAALAGARQVLAERIAHDRRTRGLLRNRMRKEGVVRSHATKLAEQKGAKYSTFHDFSEPVRKIPPHRMLAILQGVHNGVLRLELAIDDDAVRREILETQLREPDSPFEPHIREAVAEAYERLLRPSIENEVLEDVRRRAQEHTIAVFRDNARSLLMAPPAGPIVTLGIHRSEDGAFAIAVVGPEGQVVTRVAMTLNAEPDASAEASTEFVNLVRAHQVKAIAVGNGPGSRSALRFSRERLREQSIHDVIVMIVNEAGAGNYAKSKIAREELPEADAADRIAVSIARRLQDPLMELVKIEPRSIGVGQYQHEVNQKELRNALHRTVVSCISRVGLDVNTAPVHLLRYVNGIQYGTAQNIVAYREKNDGFKSREELLNVEGIGSRVYEQCAGHLRVTGGTNPLDATAIHPEAYPVVETMAQALGKSPGDLLRDKEALEKLDLKDFQLETIGPLALEDIRRELVRPGRDPRRPFRPPRSFETDGAPPKLEKGSVTDGIVTNVTDFGAFIDVGADQDGLVHLSEIANSYVRDPRQFVHVGQIVRVKILDIDSENAHVSLSMKAVAPSPGRQRKRSRGRKDAEAKAAKGKDKATSFAAKRRGERNANAPRKSDRSKRDSRTRGQRPSRPAKPDSSSSEKSRKDQEPLNTQLADQLAELKERFGA